MTYLMHDFTKSENLSARSTMITLHGVTKIFAETRKNQKVVALNNINMDIFAGEIFGIIGRSGAGKSTLIRVINGLERPTSGQVVVDGVDVSALNAAQLRAERRRIGMIFQHFNLLSSRTAFGNVALPLELTGTSSIDIKKRVDELLELVGLADKRDRYPAELSGGQKQRVGIARALATKPKVLLSDEATSALDPETTRSILALLKKVNQELGVTIVLITHEMAVVREICDRVAVLEAGLIIEQADVFDIITRPKTETARSFLGELSGWRVPDSIATRLRSQRSGTTHTVYRLTLVDGAEANFSLSRLARQLDADIRIVQARVETLAERSFGTIIVEIANIHDEDGLVESTMNRHGVVTERLGYVY